MTDDKLRAAMKGVVLSTGDMPDHVPVEVVFAPVYVGKLGSTSIQAELDRARDGLRLAALAVGATAVANCRFDHTMHGQTQSDMREAWSDTTVVTVVAYGTAVRRQSR